MKYLLYDFVVLILLIPLSSGIFFHITEGGVKCFLEEVPEDTLIAGETIVLNNTLKGTYKVAVLQGKEFLQSPDYGVHVEVYDPDMKVILSRVYASEGRFVVTSQTAGDYRICLSSNSTAWIKKHILRVSLDIAVGDHALNYKEIASKEKLNDIQLRVRQLLDQVAMLAKDQDFQRAREEYFRRLSESINNRVTWWAIAQVILLVLTGLFQMRNLRSFFLAKKLV